MKNPENKKLLKLEALLNILEDLEEERDKVRRGSKEWGSTFNAMTDMISVHDRNCVILKVNKAFADAFKGKPEDFVGKKCYKVVHHTEKEIGICPMKETLKTRKLVTIEIYEPVLKKYLEVSTVPFFVNGNKEVETVIHTMRDITERKKSEAALRESETNYRMMVETSNDMIWVLDHVGKFVYINSKAEQISGYKSEDILKKGFTPMLLKEDLPRINKIFLETLAGKSQSYEVKVKKPDGSLFILEVNTAPMIKGDKIIGTVSFGKDITEGKRAEKELIKNKDRLEKAQEIGLIGTWNLDILKNKLEWTRECYKIFGVKQGIPMNLEKFFKIVHPDDREYVSKKWDEGMAGEEYDIEHRILVSKKVKWVREKAELKLDNSGKAIHAVGIVQDITEKKKAEEEIKKLNEQLERRAEASEVKYKTIYDSSADAIMILEPPTWKFTAGNFAAIKMFGVKDEKDFTTRPPWEYSPGKQPNGKASSVMAKAMIMKAMKEGSNYFEWIHKRLGDGVFPATVLLTKVRIGGKDVLQATVRDITEAKQAQKKLESANKELKSLDVAKSDFLNTISHELKTPLTAMVAHLDVLGDVRQECINQGTGQKQCGLSLDAIKNNNSQLNFLIDNLLEVARMQSKTFKLDVAKFNVRELVLEVVNDFLPLATQKGLKIYYSVDKSLVLRADRNRVKEILNNLIDNAIKFTEKGKIMIRIKGEGEFVSIAVEDSGIGIGKEDIPNLFKKFFQVKRGLERGNGVGTGLGLTIINKLAILHGGKVFVKSVFGKGSTFTVKLPMKGGMS